MTSFRESGQLEQDADTAMLLWASDPTDNRSDRELKIAKNKDGERDTLELAFNGAIQTMTYTAGSGKSIAASFAAEGRKAKLRAKSAQIGFQELAEDDLPPPF